MSIIKQKIKIGDLKITVDTESEQLFLTIMDKGGFCFNREETERIYKLLKAAFEPDND